MIRRRFLTCLSALSLILCVGTAVLWVRSYSFGYYVTFSDGLHGSHVSVARGNIRLVWQGGWLGPNGEHVFSMPNDQVGDYSSTQSIYVPMWIVLGSELLGAVIYLWLRGKGQAGLCPICSYNLTGNRSGVCPERGTPISQKAEAAT